MSKVSLNQTVVLFSDDDRTGIQEVDINSADELGMWLTVSHCGTEFNMSIENWNKLIELVEKAKSQL